MERILFDRQMKVGPRLAQNLLRILYEILESNC